MTTRTRTITITCQDGRSCKQMWKQETLICPSCGNASLWACEAHDDYYQGIPYLCVDCGSLHHINSTLAEHGGYKQSLAKLRRDTVP